jgi:hypothetical protein
MPFTVIVANSAEELRAVLAAVGGLTSIAAPVATSVTPTASAPTEAPRRRGRPPKSATAAPVAAPAVVEEPAAEESEDASEASPVAEVEEPVAAKADAEPKVRKSRTRNPHPNPFAWGEYTIDNRNNVFLLEKLLEVEPTGSGAERTLRLNKITNSIESNSAKSLFYADTKRLIELGVIVRQQAGDREFVIKLVKGARAKLVRAGAASEETSTSVESLPETLTVEGNLDLSADAATGFEGAEA